MRDKILTALAVSYLLSAVALFYLYMHPTYNWTPREVAREHIYDYPPLR